MDTDVDADAAGAPGCAPSCTVTPPCKVNFVLPVVETIGYVAPFLAQSLFSVAHLPDVVSRTGVTVLR